MPLPWPAGALRDRLRGMNAVLDEVRDVTYDVRKAVADLDAAVAAQRAERQADRRHAERLATALRWLSDDVPRRRERLWALRSDPVYGEAYTAQRPLVSVIIPTYDNHRLLRERALPSVLAQTYEELEVIVVGDAAGEAARQAVEDAGDPRVRFVDLPYRGPYPDDPAQRWYVAGVPPFNEGLRQASGLWIAPLDDDDAFAPDHVEVLLRHARDEAAELAYGRIRMHYPGGREERVGAFPPRYGSFNLQASLCHAGVARLFPLELVDALWEEPYDWAVCRRMLDVGVRMAMLDRDVVDYFPSQAWTPRWEETLGEPPPPEWEVAPEGWEAARGAEREAGAGWDVEAVARAYERRWPDFLAAIDGPGPLGVAHEAPEEVAIGREDPLSHNIVLSFGHALARAARGRDAVSVLDWGGALGHYHELARRLLDDVALDYHCRELPAVCAAGRRVSPAVTFHEADDCLEHGYDLVMASGSLQYADDWAELLGRLAGAADPWLYVTRVPAVRSSPSYVARQRAYAYGYETEYVGWVLSRDELVETACAAGLELVRELVLVPPMPIRDAPEDPVHLGLLFRREGSP